MNTYSIENENIKIEFLTKGATIVSIRKKESSHTAFLTRFDLESIGGGKRDRTDDPLLAKQVLYQLSYAPVLGGSGRT